MNFKNCLRVGILGLLLAANTLLAQPLGFTSPAYSKEQLKARTNALLRDEIITNFSAANLTNVSLSLSPLPTSWKDDAMPGELVLPPAIPDPLEPFNRVVLSFNNGTIAYIVKPTARVYRAIVRPPVRQGITGVGRTLTFPGRLANNLLQQRWDGAHTETERFFCNTVLGLGGFFDVASRFNIGHSEADWGQTFGTWGWKPDFFLMLPLFGPSSDRDGLGVAADALSSPITYFDPYSYIQYGIAYNNLAGAADAYVRFSKSEADAYSEIEYAWTFIREEQKKPNFTLTDPPDPVSLETVESILFTFKDPEFPNRGITKPVFIPATGKELKYTYWLQKKNAPIVYIIPGLGSHRLTGAVIALAELAYNRGFSAVAISSPYNYEFMENASTAALPAYSPVDAHDVHTALTLINRDLEKKYPGKIGKKALLGYSMGAFQSLIIAGTPATNTEALLEFDRFVAINPPVRLLYGVAQLDKYYRAPLAWPAETRTSQLENTFLKVSAIAAKPITEQTVLPFSGVESQFLIGLNFRFILRDIIYSSQLRHNQGVLKEPFKKRNREALYKEILSYSYKDYFEKFALPYYQSRGIDLTSPDALEKASDLRTYSAGLKGNSKIRLMTNKNDFLLPEKDYEWLEATFDPAQVTIFAHGGHLGNLGHPAVQKVILSDLDDLGATAIAKK